MILKIVITATEKARLPIFSLVLGTKSCLETDDLRVLKISEKCSRLTKSKSTQGKKRLHFHYKETPKDARLEFVTLAVVVLA